MNPFQPRSGFSIVELLIILAVILIVAAIGIVNYNGWHHRSASSRVKSDVLQAASGLENYKNFKNDYPPNLAGIEFAASDDVALTLRTNAPQTRTYENLDPDQNAQLFLNTCNANMPITSDDGSIIYNTACTLSGNNIHIKGQVSSNVVINGPSIDQNDIELTCGPACDAAISAMTSEFAAQNGTFPLAVPKNQVPLPPATLTTYGSATLYCLEGRSGLYSDIAYHADSVTKQVSEGPCPDDETLHYP